MKCSLLLPYCALLFLYVISRSLVTVGSETETVVADHGLLVCGGSAVVVLSLPLTATAMLASDALSCSDQCVAQSIRDVILETTVLYW